MRPIMIKIFLVLLAFSTASLAGSRELNLPGNIKDFIGNYCIECHNKDKKKGGTRLDNVLFTIKNEADAQHWKDILDVMNVDDMPPKKAKQPSLEEKSRFIGELTEGLEEARALLVDSGGEILIRHMNRREYQNVIKDMLGVDIKIDELPFAPRSHFDTMAKTQHFSSIQFETYNKLAEQALNKMFADEKEKANSKPRLRRHEFEGKKKLNWQAAIKDAEKNYKQLLAIKDDKEQQKKLGLLGKYERDLNRAKSTLNSLKQDMKNTLFNLFTKGAILGASKNFARGIQRQRIKVGQLGTYRFKVKVASTGKVQDKGAFLQVNHGHRNDPEKDLVYYFPIQGTITKPSYIEFSVEGTVNKAVQFTLDYYNSNRKAKPVFYDWIEIDGPYYSKNESAAYKLLKKYDLNTISESGVKNLFSEFAELAFRSKKPSPVFIDGLFRHFQFIQESSDDLRSSIIKSLAVILSTPHFLYITEYNSGSERVEVTDLELAHRLSFFLWSSLPDARLLQLAKSGELKDKATLSAEIDRMISDKKSDSLYNSFISQWLDIWKLEGFDVNHKSQREFFNTKLTMMKEPAEFFKYLARSNESAVNFIDSDFIVADSMLAKYYGLAYPGGSGNEFHKINLSNNSMRGGLLGQAAILAITSRTERTSPIDRGAYVLRKMLNSPPPEPPANVPDADFDAEGKTMRQILEIHQSKPQCSSCHKKIDPLGFAMEGFNQLGAVRSSKEMKDVDTSGKMPDGSRQFKDFNGMKQLLVEDKEMFIAGFSEALLSYALGRGASFTDQDLIKQIVASGKAKNYPVRDIIKQIVFSKQFFRK